jgi:Protein of unknown function (DUF2924)
MDASLQSQINELGSITMGCLKTFYRQVFGQPTHSNHRDHLIRRITWKLQSSKYGDVSESILKRALEIANEGDLNGRPGHPRRRGSLKRRRARQVNQTLRPGAELSRTYRERTIVVKVLDDGFEYEGKRFSSLSAVARAVTGTPWNGLVFFGLKKRELKKRRGPSIKPEAKHAA